MAKSPPQALLDYIDSSNIALTLGDPSQADVPLIHCNDAFCRLTMRDRSELLGRNCRILQNGHNDQKGLDKIRAYLASDSEKSLRVQLVNFRADDTPFVNLLTMSRICDQRQDTCFIFASQFDVSGSSAEALIDYDAKLMDALDRPFMSNKENQLYIMSSVQMVADAAATIAKARLTLETIDEDGPLF